MRKRFLLACAVAALIALAVPSVAFAKTATRLAVTIDGSWEHYDLTPELTGTLKTSGGKALKSQSVSLYYDGSKVSTKKTDSSGRVVFKVSLPGADLEGVWSLRYAGTSKYASSASAKKKTRADIHYMAGSQVPEAADLDGDGVTDYYVWMNLRLLGDSTYGIWTSQPTERGVYLNDDDNDLYASDASERDGSFVAATEGMYAFYLFAANSEPVDIFIW